MSLNKTWHFPSSPEPTLVQQLSDELQLSPLVISILIRRGYSSVETIRTFLHPPLSELRDPYVMRHMKAAVELLKEAILSQQRIVILGDYDVDGITATAMMMLFLQACGCQNIDYFITMNLLLIIIIIIYLKQLIF